MPGLLDGRRSRVRAGDRIGVGDGGERVVSSDYLIEIEAIAAVDAG